MQRIGRQRLRRLPTSPNNMSGTALGHRVAAVGDRSLSARKAGAHAQTRGELFAILTCGSFKTLQLEFDDHDNMQLAGIRQDGRRVPVAGIALARRISSILRSARRGRGHLGHAEPMPFIADDLFINFDDNRAAAGFRVLANSPKRRKSCSSPTTGICWRWRERHWARRPRSHAAGRGEPASATLAGRMKRPRGPDIFRNLCYRSRAFSFYFNGL